MTKTELNNQHLDWLEAESIHIIREVVAECENPALLFFRWEGFCGIAGISP